MSAPRFLIAKYVNDVRRMEPHNIGVILWADGAIEAKFLGETRVGDVECKPIFIRQKNLSVYQDWVTYWRLQMEKGELPLNGVNAGHNDARFLDALRKQCREHYILVEGGFLAAGVPKEKLREATKALYDELVGDEQLPAALGPRPVLDQLCQAFVRETGLADRPNFLPNYPVRFTFRRVERCFPFDYGIGPGGAADLPGIGPSAVFQKTQLDKGVDVNSTLFMMESMQRPPRRLLPKSCCASLVYAPSDSSNNPVIQESLASLERVSIVIDMADTSGQIAAFHRMRIPSNGHPRGSK